MGMAHLLGQLGLAPNPEIAMALLYQAATRATLENPQPAYVFALILLAEFTAATIPDQYLHRYIPPQSSRAVEARIYLERAGYLHFAPAQYKLGNVHEFAQEPFPFDPVLSVQWYNAAALQGEAEAEMALSKWFLVGAEGYFDKDEDMSLVFAQKAAAKGLPAAEFALGYYYEVGIGPLKKDAAQAVAWYKKAHDHGAPEAAERLQALSQSVPQTLGREEHTAVMEDKLVRKQTSAKQRAMARQAEGGPPREQVQGRQNGDRVVKHIRKNTIERIDNAAGYANGHGNQYNPGPPPNGPRSPDMRSAPPNGQYPHDPRSAPPNGQYPPDPRSAPLNGQFPPGPDPRSAPPPMSQYPPDPRSAPPTIQSFPDLRHVGGGAGSMPPSPGGHPQRPDMGRMQSAGSVPQIQQQQHLEVSQSVPTSPTGRRPTTFAEMGIPSAKVPEKQDCVIM